MRRARANFYSNLAFQRTRIEAGRAEWLRYTPDCYAERIYIKFRINLKCGIASAEPVACHKPSRRVLVLGFIRDQRNRSLAACQAPSRVHYDEP